MTHPHTFTTAQTPTCKKASNLVKDSAPLPQPWQSLASVTVSWHSMTSMCFFLACCFFHLLLSATALFLYVYPNFEFHG